MDLSKLVSESIQEGKKAMDEREAELRREERPRRDPASVLGTRPRSRARARR